MPRCRSLLSVGCVTALGCTVVSTVTRAQCFCATAPPRLRGGQALGQQHLQPLGPDALAPARHRGAVERQGVPEVDLAAEQLDVGAVEVAGADRLVGQAVHVLEQVQPDHQPRRQAGPADRSV